MKKIICLSLLVTAFAIPAECKFLKMIQQGHVALATDVLQSILAKEMCTCVHVNDFGLPDMTVEQKTETCLESSQLPVSKDLIEMLTSREVTEDRIEIDTTLLGAILSLFQGDKAVAVYEGPDADGIDRGCRLL